MSSSSFRVTKFISAWNILISNVAIYKHGLQIHPYQHTFLTELQTEIHIPDSRKSCDIMSEAFLKMSSRHTLSLGLLTAVDGVKRAPWALDSVKSLLHSVSSSHGTISLDNDFSKLPEYDSLVKSLIEVMLNMDDVSNDKISHVAKLAMRTTVTLPECRISPIGREVIMKFLESVARTKSWSIYSRLIIIHHKIKCLNIIQ